MKRRSFFKWFAAGATIAVFPIKNKSEPRICVYRDFQLIEDPREPESFEPKGMIADLKEIQRKINKRESKVITKKQLAEWFQDQNAKCIRESLLERYG